MCPDLFLGCCSDGHNCSHIASILKCVCTTRPSRTWSEGVVMINIQLLKAATHSRYTVLSMCSNPSMCPFRFPQATSFKWLKLFNRSTYSSAEHGCTLELLLQSIFTSQITTVTACRVKTEGVKPGLLSVI